MRFGRRKTHNHVQILLLPEAVAVINYPISLSYSWPSYQNDVAAKKSKILKYTPFTFLSFLFYSHGNLRQGAFDNHNVQF